MFAAAVLILLAAGCRSGAGGSGIGEFAAVEETPRAVISDAILNADVPKDGIAVGNGNPGLGLLRDIVRESAGQAVHLSIGALWCPGCRQEIPYKNKLIDDYAGRPLRGVSFYIESQEAYDKELKTLDGTRDRLEDRAHDNEGHPRG